MTDDLPGAGPLLTRYGDAIRGRDWNAMRAVLADDAEALLLHTGERLDADALVAFNRGYPGAWEFHVDEVVDAGARGVLRSHTTLDGETYHAATFATAVRGRLTAIVEVWTEAVAPHPDRSTS